MTIEIADEHVQAIARAVCGAVRVLSWAELPGGELELCLATGPLRVTRTWVIPAGGWWKGEDS